ncbi:MAG: DinB family protein [Candidatus Acidiferrales bacterium]
MTRGERIQKVESFGCAPMRLAEVLRKIPKKMWLFKPEKDRWSIHEIILHLADSEANAYIRCRRLIAEPGKPVLSYDVQQWAGSLGYFHQSTHEALEVIRRLRRMTYQLLVYLPEPVWSHTAEHPEKGKLTLDEWLDMQIAHIPHHIEQMKQNYQIWLKLHPPRKSPRPKIMTGPGRQMVSLPAGI